MKVARKSVITSAPAAFQLASSDSCWVMIPCMPLTRYVAGMNCATVWVQGGSSDAGIAAPLRNIIGM